MGKKEETLTPSEWARVAELVSMSKALLTDAPDISGYDFTILGIAIEQRRVENEAVHTIEIETDADGGWSGTWYSEKEPALLGPHRHLADCPQHGGVRFNGTIKLMSAQRQPACAACGRGVWWKPDRPGVRTVNGEGST